MGWQLEQCAYAYQDMREINARTLKSTRAASWVAIGTTIRKTKIMATIQKQTETVLHAKTNAAKMTIVAQLNVARAIAVGGKLENVAREMMS